MEIKATLQKPYSEEQRINFIVEQNHRKGYEIKETETSLQAWGAEKEEMLKLAKDGKLQEALYKANDYINNVATYRDIECTDGNISKLTAYLIAMEQGLYQDIAWVTKSDNVITLTIEDVMDILENIGNIQTEVWTNKYISYKEQIENAETIEDVDAIVIDYQ